MKIAAALAVLAAFPLSASAQSLDWTKDVVAQFKAANVEAPAAPAAAHKPAVAVRIEGVPRAGGKTIPTEAAHQHTVSAWVDADRKTGHLEGVYSDCDDTIDDCQFALFDFPQVTEYWGGSLLYKDEPIGGIPEGTFGVTLINDYRVAFSRKEEGGAYRVSLAIEKPATELPVAYYEGTMTLGSEQRLVCFSLSPEKIDQFVDDPDVSHGVFVSQAIESFRERGLKYSGDCATALEYNGGYIRTCSGLFLTEATTLKDGPIFDNLSRFNPNDGSLSRRPVGRYSLKSVASCPK